MTITILVRRAETPPPPQPSVAIKKTRKYGDPVMVELMGLDTVELGTSNFQNVSLWTKESGFGAVSQFMKMGVAQLHYLMSLQPIDAGSFNSKMQFLVGYRDNSLPSRPYWTRGATWQDPANITSFEWGPISFGGQMIGVQANAGRLVEYQFWAKYQQKPNYENIIFYRVAGLRWADRHNVTHLMQPHLIQRGTWATWNTNPPNQYRDTWHGGVVYSPVWDAQDFPLNNGARELYIAKAFLE